MSIRHSGHKSLAVVLMFALAWTPVGSAASAPTLDIAPPNTRVGGSVTIRGATVPSQTSRDVQITLDPPGAAPSIVRTVQLVDDPGGPDHNTFAHTETGLSEAGIWQVRAQGPVAQVPASTGDFLVALGAAYTADSCDEVAAALEKTEEFSDAAEAEIEAFGALPEKDIALDKLVELMYLLAGFQAVMATVADAMRQAHMALDALEAFPEMTDAMNEVAQQVEAPVQRVAAARQELQYTYQEMNNAAEWARMFHFQKVGFQKALAILQFSYTANLSIKDWAKGKLDGAINSVRDKLLDQAAIDRLGLTPKQVADARAGLANIQQAKSILETQLDPNGNFGDMKRDAAFKIANWFINWISGAVGQNVSMYAADVKGSYHCDYYAAGEIYMVAKYPWEGQLELFFQKRTQPTDVVRLSGILRGKFGWRTGEFYPERVAPDVPGMAGVGIVVPRAPDPRPYHFAVELEGIGTPDFVELEVTKVHYDIEWLKYGLISVLWSPDLIVPAVDLTELRVPGGHWFVTRATNTAGNTKTFRVPLTIEDDVVLLKHVFDREMDYFQSREFIAALKMEIDGKETGI